MSDTFKTQARVEVDPVAKNDPIWMLLVLVGWYLIILTQEDSAAAATAAAT